MTQLMGTSLTRFKRSSGLLYLCDNVTKSAGRNLHACRKSIAYYQNRSTCVNCSKSNLWCTSFPLTSVLPDCIPVPFKSQAVFYKTGVHDHGKEENVYPNNDEMNLRHSVENDYLSWMRNSYMMTLAGLTILNTSSLTDNMFISEVVFLTAFLNMTAGTMGYLHSLSSLRKRKVMKQSSSFGCQIAAILHLFLWVSVLILIANPDKDEEEGEKGEILED